MIGQFEAEKCLHAASTDNLVLIIIDNRPNPRATQMIQIPGPGRCKTLGGLLGGLDICAWND